MKRWLITGASGGLGAAFAEAALCRGDRVALTSRDPSRLDEVVDRHGERVLTLALDVTDRSAVRAAVADCAAQLGGIDVLVNNAGTGGVGALEEVTEREARALFDANVFGPLWLVQACLPYMRAEGRGHIVQVSSVAGVVAFPIVGLYSGSKWALEGMSEALLQEVRCFGVHVTVLELGAMRTDWAHRSMPMAEDPLDAYDEQRARRLASMEDEYQRRQPGDPARAAQELLRIVDMLEPPSRVVMGSGALELIRVADEQRGAERTASAAIARATDFPDSR